MITFIITNIIINFYEIHENEVMKENVYEQMSSLSVFVNYIFLVILRKSSCLRMLMCDNMEIITLSHT